MPVKKPVAKRSQPQNNNQPPNHTQISVQSHMWKAPLPPPAVLEEFNRVVDNGAERIVKAWEDETAHRRKMERDELRKFYGDARLGKFFAFLFVLAALGVAAFAAWIGAEWLGVVLGAGTIGSVVWGFVQGKKIER